MGSDPHIKDMDDTEDMVAVIEPSSASGGRGL